MKVCFIAGHYAKSTDGIGRYTSNLISYLQKLEKNIEIEIIGFNTFKYNSNSKKISESILIPPQFNKYIQSLRRELGYYERFKNNNKILLKNLSSIKADIYHAVSPSECVSAIKLNKRPLVTTIHDVIPLLGDNRYYLEKLHFNYYCKYAVQSDLIVVDSTNTKKDILHYFKLPESKIKVIYPGIDDRKFYPHKAKKIRIKKQILYLGGLTKRKGIYETIYAFKQLLGYRSDVELLVGGNGEELSNLKDEIKRLDLEKKVLFLGFVDERKLIEVYHNADLFVYPSKYEGFGLTPLEAMASGLPVITSSTSSLPEVVGKAGALVNPNNVTEIFVKMKSILESESLQRKMSIKGIEQAKKFTWYNCAQDMLDIYKTLM